MLVKLQKDQELLKESIQMNNEYLNQMQVKSTKVNIKKTEYNTTFKMQTLKIPPHWALVEKLEEITQQG